jgi:hypothetical protein
MTTKGDIVNNIKNWMKIEQEMKLLQKELKERRDKKTELTKKLVEIMKTNDIDCFDLSEGKIIYTKNNVKCPLNKTYLMNSLNKYFANNPNIKTDEIGKFIMENRETKTKESIRHKRDKNT